MLVWDTKTTSWDNERLQIVVEKGNGNLIRLSDGDPVELSGGHIGPGEYDWEVAPAEGCLTDVVWQVDAVTVLEAPFEPATPGEANMPLALVDAQGAMEALATGTLRITPGCTFLDQPGTGEMMLVWDIDIAEIAWDNETSEIVYESWYGTVTRLRDGDKLTLGGGGVSPDNYDWEVPPAEGCLTDTVWQVGDVTVLQEAADESADDAIQPSQDGGN